MFPVNPAFLPRQVFHQNVGCPRVPIRAKNNLSRISLTGSPEPTLLDIESGLPEGWAGLQGVIPVTPVAPSKFGDILDVLCPIAEGWIALEDGIRIDRQAWLSGSPPVFAYGGDKTAIDAVLIDGRMATLSDEDCYVTPGWDSLGDHNVWCIAGSRTYSIQEGAEDWEPWDAYRWSHGEDGTSRADERPAICGVLVCPLRLTRAEVRHPITVPASTPVLIGATPGEIEFAKVRQDIRGEVCVGFPLFDPVWAIPADPVHCDKLNARVLLAGAPRPAGRADPAQCKYGRHPPRVNAWYTAIRRAGSKGLKTDPARADVADLWKSYKLRAKALWRCVR